MKTCDEPGCKQKHHAHGKCSKHYQRLGREQGWFLDDIPAEIAEAAEVEASKRLPLALAYLKLRYGLRRSA
jgi:hypothetical protein